MNMKISTSTQEHKLILEVDYSQGRHGQGLPVDEAEKVIEDLETVLSEVGRESFRQWLLQFESDTDVLEVNGKNYRFKMVAEKEFLMRFGHITIPRHLYQQDEVLAQVRRSRSSLEKF